MPTHAEKLFNVTSDKTIGQVLRERVGPLEVSPEQINQIIGTMPIAAVMNFFGKNSASIVENLFNNSLLKTLGITSSSRIISNFQGSVTQLVKFTKARGNDFLDLLRRNLSSNLGKSVSGEEFLAIINELDQIAPKAVDDIIKLSGSNLRKATKSLFTTTDEAALDTLKAIGTKSLTGVQKTSARRLGDFVAGERKAFEPEKLFNLPRKK